MRFSSIIILLILIVSGCNKYTHQNSFANKYLIYSKDSKTDDSIFFAPYFIANIDDTIFEVDNSFGYRYWDIIDPATRETRYETYSSHIPYKVKKQKDGIYYIYYYRGKEEEIKRYSFERGDTISYKPMYDHRQSVAQFLFSVYSGIDTNILFQNQNMKCKKIIEQLADRFDGTWIYERYLEKNSSLPVMINIFHYPNYDYRLCYKTTYMLRFTLDKSEVKSKEFDYPRDFFTPIDYYSDTTQHIEFDTIIINGKKGIIKKEK